MRHFNRMGFPGEDGIGMHRNICKADRRARMVLGLVLIPAGFLFKRFSGVFWIAGGVLLVTAFIGFCGLYRVFGINTCDVGK